MMDTNRFGKSLCYEVSPFVLVLKPNKQDCSCTFGPSLVFRLKNREEEEQDLHHLH